MSREKRMDIELACNSVEQPRITATGLATSGGRDFGVPAFPTRRKLLTMPSEVDVAIIGAGPVGTGIACELWHRGLRDRFVLLDSLGVPLAALESQTRRLGQRVMRSPFDHQIAPDGDIQLLDFARLHWKSLSAWERRQTRLAITGQRAIVAADLFFAHCRHVAYAHCIHDLTIAWHVSQLSRRRGNPAYPWCISNGTGRLHAKNVVLATGSDARKPVIDIPESCATRVHSVYSGEMTFDAGTTVACVGGGLTGAHVVHAAITAGCRVHWITNGPLRFRCTDVHSRFTRHEGLEYFNRADPSGQRNILRDALRSSVMLEFAPLVRQWLRSGVVTLTDAQVEAVVPNQRGLLLRMRNSTRAPTRCDSVYLATGLYPRTDLLALSCKKADATFPAVNRKTLEIVGMPGVYAAGAIATSGIGPIAKNIDGARLAAERLVPAISRQLRIRSQRKMGHASVIRGTRAIGIR